MEELKEMLEHRDEIEKEIEEIAESLAQYDHLSTHIRLKIFKTLTKIWWTKKASLEKTSILEN